MNEILQVAMFAGQMILENGGETYRVEETIWRICKIYGADEAESFATPTGIMASICHHLESSGHGDLVRGLPRGYSKGTIDGPNLLSYRYYIADNVRAI